MSSRVSQPPPQQPPQQSGSLSSSSNSNTANTLSVNNAINIKNKYVSHKRYGGGISRLPPEPNGSSSSVSSI